MKKLILLATCLLTMAVPARALDGDTCEMVATMWSIPMKFYQDGLSYKEAKAKSSQFVKSFEKFPEQQEFMGNLIATSLDEVYVKQKGKIKIGKTEQEKEKAVLDYATKSYETCLAK